MAVKQVQSATRVLGTFEALVAHQPIGVGALARVLADDKSAVQRALMTLADAGWIRRTTDDTGRWEATTRVLALAHRAHGRSDLRRRARPVLEQLRQQSGETSILNVLEDGHVVVLDVAESNHLVRTVPEIGLVVPTMSSAAGQAILASLEAREIETLLDGPADNTVRKRLAAVRARGWSVNSGDVAPGASGVGAVVLDTDGRPIGSITLTGPAERMTPSKLDELGQLVAAAAATLSHG